MANKKHLQILKKGSAVWNKSDFRRAFGLIKDFTNVDLSSADLSCYDLSSSDFSNSDLFGASFIGASAWNSTLINTNCYKAKFEKADFFNTNCSGTNFAFAYFLNSYFLSCDLSDSKLCGATLETTRFERVSLKRANFNSSFLQGTIFDSTILNGVDFRKARMSNVVFSNTDLSDVLGLDDVVFDGPSSIGIDTFFKSKGKIPLSFLKGAGVPDVFIDFASSLSGRAYKLFSAFISYSAKDEYFAKRLHADLQAKGVRCWLFPEDAKWGEPIWGEIDSSIKIYDKLLVICSENSLQSLPVQREIERALQREDKEKKNVLFPIRIDDYLIDGWQHVRRADVVCKVVGDFRNWKDHDSYQKAFDRLLKGLNAKPNK